MNRGEVFTALKYLHIEETCATNGNKAVLKADFIGSRLETAEPQTPTQRARQTNCRLKTKRTKRIEYLTDEQVFLCPCTALPCNKLTGLVLFNAGLDVSGYQQFISCVLLYSG